MKACDECIFTPSTASAYGPIVTADSLVTLNLGGCLALAIGDPKILECGIRVANAEACTAAACAHCVAVGIDAYEACEVQARRNPACLPYATNIKCEALFLDGGSICASGSQFILVARRLAAFFCASDVGTDAATD